MQIVLFDIDGTLISSGGAGKAAMEAALVSEFGVPQVVRDIPYSGRTDRAIGKDLFAAHGIHESQENWLRFVEGYLGHLPDCLVRHTGQILPGISSLLERLLDRPETAVGLLTGNLRAGARLKLGHFDLYRHFDFGGFGDEHFDRDDVAREAWRAIQNRYDGTVRPEEIWVIGDTPLDIRCARVIGARVAAVATGLHSLEDLRAASPDLLVEDFSEAEEFLEKLE